MRVGLLLAALAASVAPVARLDAAPVGAPPPSTKSAVIAFDPPDGEEIRYRTERVVEKDGQTEMTWSVSDYTFSKDGDGYKLAVKTVDTGNAELDPDRKALMDKLAELSDAPFVLTISEDAVITGLENGDVYWGKIFDAIEAVSADRAADGKPMDETMRAGLKTFLDSLRNMPAANRLALMTRDVQPLVEFGNTEWDLGESVSAVVESESPFGGTMTRTLHVTLRSVKDGVARLSVRYELPRAEFEKLIAGMISKVSSLHSEAERAKVSAEIAKMDRFVHLTESNYEISLADGLPLRFDSKEVVEYGSGTDSKRQVTSVAIVRVE